VLIMQSCHFSFAPLRETLVLIRYETLDQYSRRAECLCDGGRSFVNHKIDLPPFSTNSRIFFGDYGGISAYQGRVVPAFMHFVNEGSLAISVALYRFKPGTQEMLK